MKNLNKCWIVASTLFLTTASFAGDPHNFSAFSVGDTLYVTLLGDGCNSYGGSLEVDPLCRSDRMTKNFSPTCQAGLQVMATELACLGGRSKPVVLEISLNKSKIAPEAQELELTYGDSQVTVQLATRNR